MAIRRQVHCVTRGTSKQDYEKITHISGIYADGGSWQETTEEAAKKIIAKEWEFFVSKGGKHTDVIVGKYLDRYYLKTEPDATEGNNLSNLPDCPVLVAKRE